MVSIVSLPPFLGVTANVIPVVSWEFLDFLASGTFAVILKVLPFLTFLLAGVVSLIMEGAFLTLTSILAGSALSIKAVIIAVPTDFAVTMPELSTTATLLLLLVYFILSKDKFDDLLFMDTPNL